MKLDTVIASLCLLFVTAVGSYIYYQRISQAQGEYENSKNIVRDITFGFTRQLKRVSSKITGLEENVHEAYILASEAVKSSDAALQSVRGSDFDAHSIQLKISEHENTIDELKKELKALADRPLPRVITKEVDAPIPVEGAAVLDQLTGTELEVLTILQSMGESGVPQIRNRINKTREHTARLLKKLFDKGFIDRNTSSMPYRYHIRKEIEELIEEQKKQMDLSV